MTASLNNARRVRRLHAYESAGGDGSQDTLLDRSKRIDHIAKVIALEHRERERAFRAAQADLWRALDVDDEVARDAALERLTALVPPPARPDPDPSIEAAYRDLDLARVAEEAAHRRWWVDVERRSRTITLGIGLGDGRTISDPDAIHQHLRARSATLLSEWDSAQAASEAAWERLFALVQARAAERRARVPDLATLAEDIAAALSAADARQPRPDPRHRPGIGPLGEGEALSLIAEELQQLHPEPNADLMIGAPLGNSRRGPREYGPATGGERGWTILFRFVRLRGEDGSPDVSAIRDLLLPFGTRRSVVTQCERLAVADGLSRAALLICGFESADELTGYPLASTIEAFEVLAKARVELGQWHESNLGELVHPVHRRGRVFAWEVLGRSPA